LNYLCAASFSFSSSDVEGGYQREVRTPAG
jgi:hypothetical protein